MDWITAIGKLTGRCHESRKIGNNTYLIRHKNTVSVSVRLHNTDVLTFHPDGSIDLCNGGWRTCTTHARMNEFLPAGYRVHGSVESRRSSNGGMSILMRGTWADIQEECTIDHSATIRANGSIHGGDVVAYRAQVRKERLEAQRPHNRARYWIARAREGKPFRGTVADILKEENQTVRVAKMRCYGLERFFIDAKTDVVDAREGYELLSFPLDRWNLMYALKMACTTTGAVYINPVPPSAATNVSTALDWMFNTENYLGTVSQQS